MTISRIFLTLRKEGGEIKKISYVCDYCGKEIVGNGTRFVTTIFDKEGTFASDETARDLHFCKGCTAMMLVTLDKESSEKEKIKPLRKKSKAEKPDKESGAKKQVKKRLDIGKVIALSNAGWSMEKIADEVGFTERQFRDALRYHRNKSEKAVDREERDE